MPLARLFNPSAFGLLVFEILSILKAVLKFQLRRIFVVVITTKLDVTKTNSYRMAIARSRDLILVGSFLNVCI